jgi:hypothetical protein
VTRTHVHYWGDDQLDVLLAEAARLRADYEDRIATNTFMRSEVKAAAKDRINNLDIAIRLMGDVADS